MGTQKVTTQIDRFGGLSDRSVPIKNTRIESPDLLNVDFSQRVAESRKGFERLHTNRLGDASLRLTPRYASGTYDAPFVRIPHRASLMNPASTSALAWYIAIGCVMASRPTALVMVANKGYGGSANANQHWYIGYDPTANTNQGAWVAFYQGGSLTYNFSVNDGDGVTTPVGDFRYLELAFKQSDGSLTFYVYKTDGTLVGSSSTAAAFADGIYVAGSQDITLGVGMSAADTLDYKYFSGSLCEFRWKITNSAGHLALQFANRWAKEYPFILGSVWPFTGYYRLNDADATGRINDSTTNENHGSLPFSPPTWAFDESEVVGTAGLEWRPRQSAYVQLEQISAGSASLANVFAGTTSAPVTSGQRWTVRGVCVPKLPPGATECPRGVILWTGTDATNPSPVAVGINLTGSDADKFQAYYMDGATLRTLTISSPLASTLVGKRVRWALSRQTNPGAAQGRLVFQLAYEAASGPVNGYYTPAATFDLVTGAPTVSPSPTWVIGRHLTAGGVQTTGSIGVLASDGSFCGILDDIQLVWAGLSTTGAAVGVGWTSTSGTAHVLQEVFDWSTLNSSHQTVFYLRFNDGHGNTPLVETQTDSVWRCAMYPLQHDGYRWDAGLVEPYEIVRPRGLWDYKRFRADGTTERKTLVVAGSSLYEVPVGGNEIARLVGSGIFQSDGLVSFSQYGSNVIMAEPNGQRPMIYDGGNLRFAGIVAPTTPMAYLANAGARGTMVAGSYYLYYTFVNLLTGDESNPSPGIILTFGSGTTNRVYTVILPTSPDPQVNARRVYMTPVSGTDGSVAYLALTVNDNSTVSYGTTGNPAIHTVPSSGTTLEYFQNKEAPQSSIVGVFRDAAFCGGNARFPTRCYRSQVGFLTRFDHDELYLDLDLDSGDPISHMIRTNNYLFVSMREGTARVYNTGDSNAPFAFDFLPVRHGPVGAQAASYADSVFYYISDGDCFKSDGQSESNVSSPDNPLYPSIQRLMREGLNPALRGKASVAVHGGKNQVWYCVATSDAERNDIVLVYDMSQGIWSKYDLAIDCIMQSEDENDQGGIVGAINGFVCWLDSGTTDGVDVTSFTSDLTGSNFGALTSDDVDIPNGATVHIYRFTEEDILTAVVHEVEELSVGVFYVKFYSDEGATVWTLGSSDILVVGAIPWYIDLLLDWGNPTRKKRANWIKVVGTSDDDANFIRCLSVNNQPGREITWTSGSNKYIQFREEDMHRLILVGGQMRCLRLRLMPTRNPLLLPDTPFPCEGAIQVIQVEGVAEILDIE